MAAWYSSVLASLLIMAQSWGWDLLTRPLTDCPVTFTTSRGAQRCRAACLSPRQAPRRPANGAVALPNSCDHRRMRIEPPGDLTVADQHLIQQIADTAEADVRLLIPQLPGHITLAVLIGGRYVIPATGNGGVSLARGKIAWAVDASRPGGIAGWPGGSSGSPSFMSSITRHADGTWTAHRRGSPSWTQQWPRALPPLLLVTPPGTKRHGPAIPPMPRGG